MIKSITINAKEWFDKVNGNSYFAGTIQVEGTIQADDKEYLMPFQHGHATRCEQEAKKLLTEFNVISCEYGQSLRRYCIDNNIGLATFTKTKCKKRDLKEIENNYNQSI